jgi:hypothetical protein
VITIEMGMFQRVARSLLLAMSRNKEHLRCLHVESDGNSVVLEATDGFCLARWTLPLPSSEPIDVVIPRPSLRAFLAGARITGTDEDAIITPNEIRSEHVAVTFRSMAPHPFPRCDEIVEHTKKYKIDGKAFSLSAMNLERVGQIFAAIRRFDSDLSNPIIQPGPASLDPILFTPANDSRFLVICMPCRADIEGRAAAT